jgi:predicted nucleic acid-binding protein
MLAVSNTSPISNLASIGCLELLKSQFPDLWIPDAVAEELTAHPDPVAQATIQNTNRVH